MRRCFDQEESAEICNSQAVAKPAGEAAKSY